VRQGPAAPRGARGRLLRRRDSAGGAAPPPNRRSGEFRRGRPAADSSAVETRPAGLPQIPYTIQISTNMTPVATPTPE